MQDFKGIPHIGNHSNRTLNSDYFIGEVTPILNNCLQQFVESTRWAPETLWNLKKTSDAVISPWIPKPHSIIGNPEVSHQVHELYQVSEFDKLTHKYICQPLAMSQSTLRRKLKLEGTNIQAIKDRAKLGLGLHLLQTTLYSVGIIADKCGFYSQSRFTDRFKSHFGLTPSELRKTKMTD
jgi:AraC-like DNA-binding protein